MLPVIKKSECTWESLQLYCRRAETRLQAMLADFNKFSLRLSKQTNLSTTSSFTSTTSRDIGYWETELHRRERDIITILKLFNTTVVLLLIHPNPFPGQEHEEDVQYLEPDLNNQFPDPLSFVNQEQQSFTPQQITSTRRHLSILNDISIDFHRNNELCHSSLNRMRLFAPQQNKNGNDDIDDDDQDDEFDDSDVSGSDVESQLMHSPGEKKQGKKHHRSQNNNLQSLNAESGLIQDSLQQSQYAINNAISSQASLSRQREIFQGVISRVSTITSRFPAINNTINAIQTRRHRDNCILATLIATCIFITLLYLSFKKSS